MLMRGLCTSRNSYTRKRHNVQSLYASASHMLPTRHVSQHPNGNSNNALYVSKRAQAQWKNQLLSTDSVPPSSLKPTLSDDCQVSCKYLRSILYTQGQTLISDTLFPRQHSPLIYGNKRASSPTADTPPLKKVKNTVAEL